MAILPLSQVASQYLSTLSPEGRAEAQGEVLRFVRWYGADRPCGELRAHAVSLYAESLGSATPEVTRRLETARGLLAYLKKAGLTSTNLAPHLRLRKASSLEAPAAGPAVTPAQLTPEGYTALREELEALRAQRPLIAEELRWAMLDKDFRENAPLDAMKDRQAHLEARIRRLEATLKSAVVIANRQPVVRQAAQVQLGSSVLLCNLASGGTVRYTIVSPNEANALGGKISFASPVGRALLDRTEGEEVEVTAPAGVLRFRIEQVQG